MRHPRPNLLIPAIVCLLVTLAAFATDFEWLNQAGRGHVRTNRQGSVLRRDWYTNAAIIMPGGGLGFSGTNDALRNYAPGRSAIAVATNVVPLWTNAYMRFPSTMSEMRHITTVASPGLTISADLYNPEFNGNFRIACDLLASPDWGSNGVETTTINLLTNGEFDATNGWATNTGWSISNSAAWYAGTGGAALVQTVSGLPTGPYGTNWWYTFGGTVSVSGAACTLECKLGDMVVTATPPCTVQLSMTNAAASVTWSMVPVVPSGTATIRVDDAYLVPCVPRRMYAYPMQTRGGASIESTPNGEISQRWARVTCVIDAPSTNIAWYLDATLQTNHLAPCSNTIPAGSFWSLHLYSVSTLNERCVRNWHVFKHAMTSNQVNEFHSWLGDPQ